MVTVPSPQSVGREFVRQYYTLLNKDPVQIHRFYTKQSWFLHGRAENGPTEPPVIGQEAIYNKIKELNFHDCHTKIRQVDSHSTVGGGVVVQVSGELSNDAKPMRRFMQTFVLAPGEGPGKYYVHNDIFRYQDEVFSEETSDETADGTVDSEGEEDIAQQVPVVSNVGNHEQSHQEQELAHDIANDKLYYAEQGQTNGSGLANQEHLMQDGDEEDKSQELQEVVIDKQLEIQHHEPSKEPTVTHSLNEEKQLPLTSDVRQGQTPYEEEEQGEDEEPEGAGSEPEGAAEEVSEDPTDAVQEKPKTWAALAASGAPPSHTITPSVTNSRPPPTRQTQQSPSQPASQQAPRSQATPARPNRDVRSGLGSRETRITARNAPDNHQVFIGNLPNGVKDDDVRNVFSQYGTILEIRLNPKNFGFVIFNSAEPVEQILNSRPIKIGNHEINIEEKKPSGSVGRGGVGNRRGGGGRGNNRGGGSGGSQVGRGGSGGPRASSRGGFGPSGGGGNSGPGSNTRGGRRDSGGRGGKKQ